jgi:hypothetical protein
LESCHIPSAHEVGALEAKVGVTLPADMRRWLKLVGFCNFGDELSFRAGWFNRVEQGHLAGSVLFAQDELGAFLAFVPESGEVVYFSRSEPGYAALAPSFEAFLEQLESRNYKLGDWVDSLILKPYEWKAV